MSLTEALAIMLPILIFSDFIAVYKYRKEFDLGTLKLMVPFAGIGIFIGSLTFSYFSEELLKFIIGVMGFLFAGHYFFFKKNKEKKSEINFFKGGIWKQTSYNNNFRKQYAGKGYVYDPVKDKFLTPQPYASWSLDSNDDWQAPITYPSITNFG